MPVSRLEGDEIGPVIEGAAVSSLLVIVRWRRLAVLRLTWLSYIRRWKENIGKIWGKWGKLSRL